MKRAWEVKRVTFTGDAFYPFLTEGFNHYTQSEFRWRVPSLEMREYDLKRATFHGLKELDSDEWFCGQCHGKGFVDGIACGECGGTGEPFDKNQG
jgi:hypothetical protein